MDSMSALPACSSSLSACPCSGAGISGKLWATFLPAEGPAEPGRKPRGVSLLMRDLQTVALYDTNGAFVGVRRPGSGKSITVRLMSLPHIACGCFPRASINFHLCFCWLVQVEGLEIAVDDVVGSTGLELKVDPGVPYVYAGFAGNHQFKCMLLHK